MCLHESGEKALRICFFNNLPTIVMEREVGMGAEMEEKMYSVSGALCIHTVMSLQSQ